MSEKSATNLLDHSISGAFLQFRMPAMIAWLSVVVLIGFATGWAVGFVPVLMAVLGLGHAIYERQLVNPDIAIGLSIDIVVLLTGVWFGGSSSVIMAFAMMFVVIASLVVDGRRRALLLIEIFAVAGIALIVDAPTQLLESNKWFLDLLVLQPVAIVVVVLALVTNELRRGEVQRGYVLGTVAHELRNDLTPVLGMSSMLQEVLTETGNVELAEMADINVAQTTMAFETIDDLLTMARIDREALDLDVHPVDLSKAVTDILQRYGLDRSDGRPAVGQVEVLADPVRLHQIVRNLCTNAMRYGGETIDVVVKADESGGGHVLIRDDGAGIAAEDLAVVFEPFGRGAAGRVNHASVGLGLWLSRNLARAMDGELIYRREDGWTVFDLRLPARQASAPPGTQAASGGSLASLARPAAHRHLEA